MSRLDDVPPTFADLGHARQVERDIAKILGLDVDTTRQGSLVVRIEDGRAWAEWDGRRDVTEAELTDIATMLQMGGLGQSRTPGAEHEEGQT